MSLANFYEITHAVVWSCHVSFPTMLNEIPAVQTLDSAILWINHYPVEKYYENQLCYPLVRVLTSGYCYLSFKQLGPFFHVMLGKSNTI